DRNVTGVQTCALPISGAQGFSFPLAVYNYWTAMHHSAPHASGNKNPWYICFQMDYWKYNCPRDNFLQPWIYQGGQYALVQSVQRSEERRVGKEGQADR